MHPEHNPLLYFRGRVALYAGLKGLGIGPGDLVAIQAYTCVAVPEAVMAVGGTPLWIDITAAGVNMDAADLARKLNNRVKAVVVQHTFGIPADLDTLRGVLRGKNLPLIEDCCHAYESTYKGKSLGAIGEAAFWSYEWGKPVIAGVGGELVCNDPLLRERTQVEYNQRFRAPPHRKNSVIGVQFLLHSILYDPRRFWWVRRAFHLLGRMGLAQSNYNPVGPDVGIAPDFSWQMSSSSRGRLRRARLRSTQFTEQRRQQAKRYACGLEQSAARIPDSPKGSETVYSRFPVFVPRKSTLLGAARSTNLEMASWFSTPVHPLDGDELRLVKYVPGSCPRAENAARTLVSLPLGPKVSEPLQRKLIDLINAHALS